MRGECGTDDEGGTSERRVRHGRRRRHECAAWRLAAWRSREGAAPPPAAPRRQPLLRPPSQSSRIQDHRLPRARGATSQHACTNSLNSRLNRRSALPSLRRVSTLFLIEGPGSALSKSRRTASVSKMHDRLMGEHSIAKQAQESNRIPGDSHKIRRRAFTTDSESKRSEFISARE